MQRSDRLTGEERLSIARFELFRRNQEHRMIVVNRRLEVRDHFAVNSLGIIDDRKHRASQSR